MALKGRRVSVGSGGCGGGPTEGRCGSYLRNMSQSQEHGNIESLNYIFNQLQQWLFLIFKEYSLGIISKFKFNLNFFILKIRHE